MGSMRWGKLRTAEAGRDFDKSLKTGVQVLRRLIAPDPLGRHEILMLAAWRSPELGAAIWDDTASEILVALTGVRSQLDVIRVVSTPRQWQAGVFGIYSPLRSIPSSNLSGPLYLRNAVVSARPFRDDATLPP
jgi:hypothetical protein